MCILIFVYFLVLERYYNFWKTTQNISYPKHVCLDAYTYRVYGMHACKIKVFTSFFFLSYANVYAYYYPVCGGNDVVANPTVKWETYMENVCFTVLLTRCSYTELSFKRLIYQYRGTATRFSHPYIFVWKCTEYWYRDTLLSHYYTTYYTSWTQTRELNKHNIAILLNGKIYFIFFQEIACLVWKCNKLNVVYPVSVCYHVCQI